MMVSSAPPLQRVQEILRRMQADTNNVECLKTCCGALAILAKDEANKLLIARDGTRLILAIMEEHSKRPDLQEAVCDLLWSLAFNNGLVKEVVGRQGGIALILKGLSSHLSSPGLVKSACGALSNLCQNTYNQNIIAAHGGIRTILSALHSHRMNAPLLPFVFDALASIIVGNQRNSHLVTDGGGIRSILAVMTLHNIKKDVVKSGCHALAILSDIQGQGARIAAADGVKVLLPALRAHVRFLHLHRIAAIVLLRMLQEATVARDIATHGGVVILLGMLWEHAREEETAAATVHILYLITHSDVMNGEVEAEVGRHLCGILPPSFVSERNVIRVGSTAPRSARVADVFSSGVDGGGGGGILRGAQGCGVECSRLADKELFNAGTVRALVLVLQAHMARKDIVRAAIRSLANLIRLCSVIRALVAEEGVLPTVLQCLAMHTSSRGITDSAVSIVAALLGAAHGGIRAFGGAPKSCKAGGGRGQFKLSVLGTNGRGQQRLKSRSQQLEIYPSLTSGGGMPTKNCFGLRFAYTPVHVESRGAKSETGLRGQDSGIDTATSVPKMSGGSIGNEATNKRRGFGTGGEGPEIVGASSSLLALTSMLAPPSCAPNGVCTSGATGYDVGNWSASMQALITILRVRRQDPALAGLVFLALEACITEWVDACDSTARKQPQQEQEQGQKLPSTPSAKSVAEGNLPEDSVHREEQTWEAAGSGGEGTNDPQHLPAIDAPTISCEGGVDITATEAAVNAREKMHQEIRESLKAGLIWAEAVPLGIRRAIEGGEGGSGASERCISMNSAGRHDIPTEMEHASKLADLSFSPVVAGGVERLCRLLSKGFTELGFDRLGTAGPLEEAVSLQAFDVNVSEVLKSLKSARQPSRSLESIKNLMQTFLPDEALESPTIESKDSVAIATEAAEKTIAFTESDSGSVGASTNDAGDTKAPNTSSISVRGILHSAEPRQSNPGKTVTVSGTDLTSDSAGGNGVRGASPGVKETNAFWAEVGAGRKGLVVSSPPELEPILPPSMNSAGVPNAEDSTGTITPEISEAVATTKTDGSCIGEGTMPATYPTSVGAEAAGVEDRLWLVYENNWAAGKGVISRVQAPDPYWIGHPAPGAVCPYPHSMEFFSSFESANLLRAVQRGPAEYDLFLRPDLHTHGHTQWFYFAIRGTHPPGVVGESVVRFNVVNLTKPDSLFAMGMRPVLYSHKDAETRGIGWRRCGHGIDYRSNGYLWHKPDGSQGNFYTLSFSVTFPYPGDTYRLAHAHPYSYTDHKRHLAQLLANERTARYIAHTVACTTLGGNECDLLTITDSEEATITYTGDGGGITEATAASFSSNGLNPPQEVNDVSNDLEEIATGQSFFGPMTRGLGVAKTEVTPGAASVGDPGSMGVGRRGGYGGSARRGSKRFVFISARVHPGETPASWMMRGMLDFLTGESAEARLLRSLFVFKIVPMLNPDGVAFGNNRCSLAGVDLNRQWKKPSRTLHPTVFSLKQLIRAEKNRKGVAMYIDLHGHSRKMNIFMYGADEKRKGVSCPSARVFPKLLSWNRLGRKYVSFKECSFAVKKGRESTARVVVARDLGIGNSYTVESTFCGVDFGPLMNHHLNTDHLQEAGVAICDSLLDYYLPNQAQREQAYRDLLARDGVEVDVEVESMGLSPRNLAHIDPASVKSSGFNTVDGSEGGVEGGGGGSEVDIAVHDSEDRDDYDEVVDNNDDIESEDDNDSEPPAALQEDADGVPDADMTIPLAQGAASSEVEEQVIANVTSSPVDVERGEPIVGAESASSAATGPRGVGALKSQRDGNDDTIGGNPWLGIEWGEGETGGYSAMRRWGTVVEEDVGFHGDAADYGDNFDAEPMSKEQIPLHHEREMVIRRDGGERVAEIQSIRDGEGRRLSGLVKKERGIASREPRGGGFAASRAMVGGAELPGSPESRKHKRRSSGSRGSKNLTLGRGLRGRGGNRGATVRQHRLFTSGIVGESATHRASNAALQATSSALVSFKGGVPIAGKSRRRVRSLKGGSASSSAPITTENGSSLGNRGSGTGSGRGRLRAREGHDISPRTRTLAFSSTSAGDPESAPPSGSSLDTRNNDEAEGETTAVVVKRGGNMRWLSSKDPAATNPPEEKWGCIGTILPLNPAQHLSPSRRAQSPFAELNTTDARCALEIGNEFPRNSDSGIGGNVSSIEEDRFGGGTAMDCRDIDRERDGGGFGATSGMDGRNGWSRPRILPILEDVGGGNGVARLGTRVRGSR